MSFIKKPVFFIAGFIVLLFGVMLIVYGLGSKSTCPAGLQRCSDGCIPANAECVDGSYCLKPITESSVCNSCSLNQKMCGMFCIPKSQKCCIAGQCEMTTFEPIAIVQNTTVENGGGEVKEPPVDTTETKVTITSAECTITGTSGYVKTYTSEISGTAQGVVGTRFILEGSGQRPIGNIIDCGAWTMRTENRSPEYYDCVRESGQPAETTWTAGESVDLPGPYETGEVYPNINSGTSSQQYGQSKVIDCP